MTPTAEMRDYLDGFTKRCVGQRWHGAHFHATVMQDIQSDVEAASRKRGDAIYAQEQAVLELIKQMDAEDTMARKLRAIAERLHDAAALCITCAVLTIATVGFVASITAAIKGDAEPRRARVSRVLTVRPRRMEDAA